MPHTKKFDYQPNEKLLQAAEAYRGKWVVIRRDEILLAGRDPLELEREADARGIEYDLIEFVPEEPPIYIL